MFQNAAYNLLNIMKVCVISLIFALQGCGLLALDTSLVMVNNSLIAGIKLSQEQK
jgi:hypothetical protein